MLKNIVLLSLFILTSVKVFSQKSYKDVIAHTIKNYNYKKIDSLVRTIGYKKGDTIKTFVKFKVNHLGKIE